MLYEVSVDLPNIWKITLDLDATKAPKTVSSLLECLPFDVGVNVWGKELYTDRINLDLGPENSKSLVERMDVAYWPPGKAICLFFGPTPIGEKGEIRPYSPVNVIGKIRETDMDFIKTVHGGMRTKFSRGKI